MNEMATLLELIQGRLDDFLIQQRARLAEISEDLSPIGEHVGDLLQGGKRFRAQFAYLSWLGSLDRTALTEDQLTASTEAIVEVCAALELFHAAALVHDDVIDLSDSRRGKPAIHKRFELNHEAARWAGNSARFGTSSAILIGDLLLGWAMEMFSTALAKLPDREAAIATRRQYELMQFEVMAGQFLDVLEENAGPSRALHEAVGRANRVMLYKTAKYSVEAPLAIGAAMAGADDEVLRSLSAFGVPLGLAFQLKDDILGVFGSPEKTGKPVGDDLREGKRTVLVGLTREALPASQARIFDELLTEGELSEQQIAQLQREIVDSGALVKCERMIEQLAEQSLLALETVELTDSAKASLRKLARLVVEREN